MMVFVHRFQPALLERLHRELAGEDVRVFADIEDAWADLGQAEIVVIGGHRVNKELLLHCEGLRWVHSISAGVEKMPFELLKEKGVQLTNSRGIHGPQMAEQILGMMLSFTRGLHVNVRNQEKAQWVHTYRPTELFEQHLLIVGAGSIGLEVARKAKAFDMVVTGVRTRPVEMPYFDDVQSLDELQGALGDADYVVLLTPLTPKTHHLIGERELSLMKESAVLINFARGDIVDEPALIKALSNGKLFGAGLDVFHQEPLPPTSPLWKMDNVIISPHNGGQTPHHDNRLIKVVVDNLRAYRAGEPLPTAVDLNLHY